MTDRPPLVLDEAAVLAALEPAALVSALARAFADPPVAPKRHHHRVQNSGGDDATLLLMPAWRSGGYLGVKVATVVPGNPARGKAAVTGSYLLLDAVTGATLMIADAGALTRQRTAAVSALAASRLAKSDSRTLLIVGAGGLAPALIEAFCAVLPIKRVLVWARRLDAAAAVAALFAGTAIKIRPVDDLEGATRDADLIGCATASRSPLLDGRWLMPGAHVDLVGSFTPSMREVDAVTLGRAVVYVDTHAVLADAGDFADPIERGEWSAERLVGDLSQLVRGEVPGRRDPAAITLFKSIGTATADLAAATLLWERLRLGR